MLKTKKMTGYCASVIIGLLVGVAFYYIQPTQWKGEALIRMGEFLKDHSPFEPVPTLIKRIQLRSFIKAVANRAKKDEIVALLDPNKGNGLRVKPIRDANSILITVVGNSAELVRDATNSIAAEILLRHDEIRKTYEHDILKEISRLDLEITNLSDRLNNLLEEKAEFQSNTAENRELLTAYRIIAVQNELNAKLNRSALLRETISSANIRSTYLLEPISVFNQRIFKSIWRACLFGALLSFTFYSLYFRWRNRKDFLKNSSK